MSTTMTKSTSAAGSEQVEAAPAKAQAMPDWYDLLYGAVQEPGQLAQAHLHFRQYSLANRWLAASQIAAKGLPLQPINTFKGWQGLNRQVRKGEKALALIMPVPVKGKKKEDDDTEPREVRFTRFMLRNHWFCLAQTDGDDFTPAAVDDKDWSIAAAMDFLEIQEGSFAFMSVNDTNRESYSKGRSISISPLAPNPMLARIREIARILLGHYDEKPIKSVPTDAILRHIEVEAVAYLVGATLGHDGLADSRARMQHYLEDGGRSRVPEKCAHRAFSAADKLINAGYC